MAEEKKKALLILFGGRSMPNMLTIIHQKPALVVAIVSKDQINQLPQLKDALTKLFPDEINKPQLDTTHTVNAFDIYDVHKECLLAVKDHPGYDWVFNITAATTLMNIGAYEAVRDLSAQGSHLSWM